MNAQISDNVAYFQGTTTVPNGWSGQPHICPGCGRCKDCGRPYEAQPFQPFTPWPGYPNPYIGDPIYPFYNGLTGTITSVQSTQTMPSGGFQVWN